jgi:8-oxo-dGTP diphosphatase
VESDAPLYERDPEAWEAYLVEGNITQPRKRVSADVIVVDDVGRILLVDPKYKPGWDTPGGMVEANESPQDAVRRELLEELGLSVTVGRLLCVDWVEPRSPWDDLLAFMFDGGCVPPEGIKSIKLRDGELTAFEFCSHDQARERLPPHMWVRVMASLEMLSSGGFGYLRNGYRA